ncbi:MAG TPA: hypothetical protein VFT99_04355 [Roseiflexaceae bacterium]|nr:hypothetical protein [Roseiflexaceae bacterium]
MRPRSFPHVGSAGAGIYRAALAIKPNYADEDWLRTTALWSERAISDSQPMRSALGQ